MNIWRPFQLGMRGNRETSAFVCGIYRRTTQCAAAMWILICGEMSVSRKSALATPNNVVIHITFLSFVLSFIMNDFFQEIHTWPQWEKVNPELLLLVLVFQQMATFVWVRMCIRVHINQRPYQSCEEKQTQKWKKRWPETVSSTHTTVVAARSGWFALPSPLSTPVALELIQLRLPLLKTELTFSSTQSCRIWTQKGCDPHPGSTLDDFYCFLLLGSDLIMCIQCRLKFMSSHIFQIRMCMLAFHRRGHSKGGSIMYLLLDSYGFRFSLNATLTGTGTSRKAAACPVITLHKLIHVTPPTRLLLAASIKLNTLCWHTRLWCWWCRNWSLFYCCTQWKLLRTSTSTKWQ